MIAATQGQSRKVVADFYRYRYPSATCRSVENPAFYADLFSKVAGSGKNPPPITSKNLLLFFHS
jgi:hypothetical protein